MRTIGFPISDKENENRRAILPTDLMKIRHPECIYIEKDMERFLESMMNSMWHVDAIWQNMKKC